MEGEGTINLLKLWIVICLGQVMEGYHIHDVLDM